MLDGFDFGLWVTDCGISLELAADARERANQSKIEIPKSKIHKLALALFMARVFANHTHDIFPAHNFAAFAKAFN